MLDSEWNKVDYHQFLKDFGNTIIVKYAPTILYSKKDKEHEAFISLIAFFFLAGGLLIYIAVTYFLAPIFFSVILFIILVTIGGISDIFLILNYLRFNIYIKPLECWVEVYKGRSIDNTHNYCFSYYPIFSGKCHPNKVKNVVYKMYQEEVLKGKISISQIEVYLKLNPENKESTENIGYYFQYGTGYPFKKENIEEIPWKFFPFEKSKNDNFLATANWIHHYEWKNDLEYDFDKLHEYAPWIIQGWNESNLKPLTEDFKEIMNWSLRNINSIPKLKPWEEEFDKLIYQNPKAYDDLKFINKAIMEFIGIDENLGKIRKVKDKLLSIKTYFRDLNS